MNVRIPKHYQVFARFISTLLLLSLLISACASASAPMPQRGVEFAEESILAAPAEADFYSGDTASNIAISESAPQTERLVIKNADLTIVVDDPSQSMDTISRMAEEMGGFVVSANLYQTQLEGGVEVPRANITIRVPAELLGEALSLIEAESEQPPINKTIDSQDVTREYVDLQSRLRNLEETENQLQEIMDDARRTEDVLSVYNELVRIREQIEVTKGQIQYYEQSAALSAISTELVPNEAVQPLTIGGWQPVGIAKSAIQTLINTLKFLANAGIWIVLYVLPVLAVLFVVVFLPISLLWRAWRRRRNRSKEETPSKVKSPEPEEEKD